MSVYSAERSDKLIKILKKLFKKDRARYEATMKKIDEIIYSEAPEHYKNLCHDLKEFRRVHTDTHFILIFKIDRQKKIIRFEDLQHHDTAYSH